MFLTRRQANRISDEIDLLKHSEPTLWVKAIEWPSEAQPPEGCKGAVQVNVGFKRLLIAADGRILNAGAIVELEEQEEESPPFEPYAREESGR